MKPAYAGAARSVISQPAPEQIAVSGAAPPGKLSRQKKNQNSS